MDARLIVDPALPGAWNMAVDEALLASAAAGGTTLRFYSWANPTLSLGYFQSILERQGHSPSLPCDCVRRSTGGGAILHDMELTYSLVCPAKSRTDPDPVALYNILHVSLIDCLGAWQVNATLGGEDRTRDDRFLCFERRSTGDVVLDGYKVCGSAQRRDRGAVLLHGSVLLARSSHAPELPGISDLSGQLPRPVELVESWSNLLAERLGVQWISAELSTHERALADDYLVRRFASREWLERR